MDTALDKKQKTKLDFVPVIFANGVDDDLLGFVAALKDERVQFDDKIYKQGENITISKRSLIFSCGGIKIIGNDGEIIIPPIIMTGIQVSNLVVIHRPSPISRWITVEYCVLSFNCR